jgi:hypothetical protein
VYELKICLLQSSSILNLAALSLKKEIKRKHKIVVKCGKRAGGEWFAKISKHMSERIIMV